jgi:uncharacterized membrane protein
MGAMKKVMSTAALLAGLFSFAATDAQAALKLCNKTGSKVGIALGYKDQKGWVSEGWWTAKANDCLVLVKTPLNARYYYVYAIDYEKRGVWGGTSQLCIRDKIFTIRGHESCTDRGYKSAKFFEVDTGEKEDWTVSLSGNKTSE